MAYRLVLYTPSSHLSAFFAVLFCCWTCSVSSGLIVDPPVAMNVSLNSVVSISCSSSDTTAAITLGVTGLKLQPNEVVMNGLKTATASFNATVNLNGTTMRCIVSSANDDDSSLPVLLLIQGPPSAPSNPVSQPIDACSQNITWLPPFTLDGVPLFYNLTITNTNTQEIVDYTSTEDEEYILSPRDLTGTYTVRIVAWNAAGSSDEISLEVVFATEGFDAVFNDLGRDGVTWILNFTAMNTCVSQAIANATIKLCPESGEQQCDAFLAPKENIEQFMNGELHLLFPVQAQDQEMYDSTLCVQYESGQELYSQSSFPIDTSYIRSVKVVSSDPTGVTCFSVTQIPGSLLYGMVARFVDTRNGNSISRVVVVNNEESVCIEDLPAGHFDISVGELDAPLLSINEVVTIEGGSTAITTSSSTPGIINEDQSVIVAAILVPFILMLLMVLILFALLSCWMFRRKNDHLNRIGARLKGDNNGHAELAQRQEQRVEEDAVKLKSLTVTEPDPDGKVSKPIQVSETERSPQIYKPSV